MKEFFVTTITKPPEVILNKFFCLSVCFLFSLRILVALTTIIYIRATSILSFHAVKGKRLESTSLPKNGGEYFPHPQIFRQPCCYQGGPNSTHFWLWRFGIDLVSAWGNFFYHVKPQNGKKYPFAYIKTSWVYYFHFSSFLGEKTF